MKLPHIGVTDVQRAPFKDTLGFLCPRHVVSENSERGVSFIYVSLKRDVFTQNIGSEDSFLCDLCQDPSFKSTRHHDCRVAQFDEIPGIFV